jgi:hypothetical protein
MDRNFKQGSGLIFADFLPVKADGQPASYNGHIHVGIGKMFGQPFVFRQNQVDIMKILIQNNFFDCFFAAGF